MRDYTVFTGEHVSFLFSGSLEMLLLNVDVGSGYVEGTFPSETHWFPLGVPSVRPVVPHGWAANGAAPMTLGMGTLPAGTAVTATNEAGESVTTDDPADPIILADPETYAVQITPPWPYLPETLTIEVT